MRVLGSLGVVLLLVTGCTDGERPVRADGTATPGSSSAALGTPSGSGPATTALTRAAAAGRVGVVARLVRGGADVREADASGTTPLSAAVLGSEGTFGHVDTVRLLVALGADVGRPSDAEMASERGQDVLAATLEAAVAPPPARPGPALLSAAADGDADRAAVALRAGADPEVRDGHRRTPLLLAATHDRLDVARLLVHLGADPDALDDRHDTPWLVTGVTGSVAMLEVLLPAGPDLTIRNRFGGNSVIPAAERGHVAYVRRVVTTGIDVNHVNDPGWTALLEAVVYGDGSPPYQDIVRILLAAGADPGIPDAQGRTALQHAESRGQLEVARLLAGG
jgi:uncharacterized protein